MVTRLIGLLRTRVGFCAAVCAGLAVLAYAGFALFEATRALSGAATSVASEESIRFTVTRLDRTPPAGFEAFSAPAVFRDAAVFQGKLYLCGPASLTEYGSNGAVRARYQAGIDIPGPLVKLATGIVADTSEPELFIATAGEGLLAFNGRAFRQIRPESIPYRTLTTILPLGTGRLLLGTEKKGVLVYDGRRIAQFHPSLADVHVTALAGDDSDIWVGTVDRGVLHWHAGQVDSFAEAEGLPDPQVLAVAMADGAAYVGTSTGVAEFQAGRFVRVLAPGFFAQSLFLRGDRLLIGTLDEGVMDLPLTAERPRSARPRGEPAPGKIERLIEMEGAIYALSEGGLYSTHGAQGSWQRSLGEDHGLLTDRNIAALDLDAGGRLWVGYFDRGLDIVDPGGSRVTHIETDQVFCINRIVHDRDRGVTAVGTANGLVLFDSTGKQRQVLTKSEGLIASQVTDVLLRAGGMTVATPAGLTFVDPGGTRSIYAFHGLVNNHVYALASAGERVLAGTLGGLTVVDGDAVRASYTTANSGLRHNWITAISQAGAEWFVGTYGAGVLRLDSTGRWHSFPDLPGSLVVNPNAMLATEAAIYAGTLADGLYAYSRTSGRWSQVALGLPSRNVTALTSGDGYIYVGTDNGLVRFLESSLTWR